MKSGDAATFRYVRTPFLFSRAGLGIKTTPARRICGRGADGARRSGDSRGRVGAGLGCARKKGSEGRLHSAHRLRIGGHRVGHGIRQEIRDQDRAEQGGVVGCRARQARQRRARCRACAVRPDLRRPDGHRRAEEGHGRTDESQPQRAGDHAVQPVEGQGRRRRTQAQGADRQREARVHVRADVPHRDARDVDLLLARGAGHSSVQRRQDHRRPAAADGRQHARRQHGRVLRRRAVGQPRDLRQDRLHGGDDAGHLEGSSGEDAGHDARSSCRRIRTRHAR